jgi:hypothetical protein
VANILLAVLNLYGALNVKNDDSTWGIVLFWGNIVFAIANCMIFFSNTGVI